MDNTDVKTTDNTPQDIPDLIPLPATRRFTFMRRSGCWGTVQTDIYAEVTESGGVALVDENGRVNVVMNVKVLRELFAWFNTLDLSDITD